MQQLIHHHLQTCWSPKVPENKLVYQSHHQYKRGQGHWRGLLVKKGQSFLVRPKDPGRKKKGNQRIGKNGKIADKTQQTFNQDGFSILKHQIELGEYGKPSCTHP